MSRLTTGGRRATGVKRKRPVWLETRRSLGISSRWSARGLSCEDLRRSIGKVPEAFSRLVGLPRAIRSISRIPLGCARYAWPTTLQKRCVFSVLQYLQVR